MIKKLIPIVASFLFIIIAAPIAYAAKAPAPTQSTTPLGNDISYPQCGKTLPKNQAFGIVGVNGGLATTTNPCLKDQLVWANKSIGGTPQEKIQLYVNTANPGGLNTDLGQKQATRIIPLVYVMAQTLLPARGNTAGTEQLKLSINDLSLLLH